MKKHLITAIATPLLVLLVLAPNSQSVKAGEPPKTIEITAKRFGFSPNQITLKKGETVTLRLTTQDVTHGFFSRPLKIDSTIEPGKPTDITITPTVAGTFTTICDHFCGAGHGNMNMTIVVTE